MSGVYKGEKQYEYKETFNVLGARFHSLMDNKGDRRRSTEIIFFLFQINEIVTPTNN